MDQSAKQSIVERIKSSTNILVTVSRDPSVDELSAALALTLMLNKMDKHATAVFSGSIPPAISFLEPGKTFENTVDSLRDFIIALDKEKADRLRYKVEGDVVRVYITPYRTTITEKDLQFSQGDFNVELVIALGVEKREDLDEAITAHGRILHDATVATINADGNKTSLGSIDWSDGAASCLCEMLMSLSEALQNGLLDEQIASALLTGLVAATERFSNTMTSPRVMTMAAQLMAAGANQQLIAAKLEEGQVLPSVSQPPAAPAAAPVAEEAPQNTDTPAPANDGAGSLHVAHGEEPELPPVAPAPSSTLPNSAQPPSFSTPPGLKVPSAAKLATPSPEPTPAPRENSEEELSRHIGAPVAPTLSVNDLQQDLAEAEQELKEAAAPLSKGNTPIITPSHGGWKERNIEPTFGGTLNATTDEAEEEKMREENSAQNHKILNHSTFAPQGSAPAYSQEEPESVDPFAEPPKADPDAPMHYEPIGIVGQENNTPLPAPVVPPAPEQPSVTIPPITALPELEPEPASPTLAELEAQAHNAAANGAPTLDDARAAVDAALSGSGPMPVPPTPTPAPPADTFAPSLPPAPTGLPPLPDFSTLPPLPSDANEPSAPTLPHVGMPEAPEPSPTSPSASPNDPGQFKIPGQ